MYRSVNSKLVCCLFLIFMASGLGSVAHADKITAFTADQVHFDANGTVTSSGKLYVAPGKIRMDGMPGAEEGQTLSIIVFPDEKRQCMLNTDKKLYFEGPLTDQAMMGTMKDMNVKSNEKVLGTELVNGFDCTKKEVTSSVEFMGMKQSSTHTVWVSDRLEMPLRTRMEDGSATELKNIVKGTPAAKVFEIPGDYKKVSNMMTLMGMEMSDEEMREMQEMQKAGGGHPFGLPQGMPK